MKKVKLENPDTLLLARLSGGDRTAFNEIYRRYWVQFFKQASAVLRSHEAAKDVVQDIFVVLWRKREELDHVQSLGTYLSTSVKHACLRYIERNINKFDDLESIVEQVRAESDVLPSIYSKELQERIDKSISELPRKMRKVFEMSRNDDMTHSEIAKELGISKETVKKHIQHALAILKANLNDYDKGTKALLIFYFLNQNNIH